MLRKILMIAESLLIAAFCGAILSSRFDVAIETLPYINLIATLTVIITATFSVIGYLRRPSSPLPYRWHIALTTTAFLAMHGTPASTQHIAPIALLVMIATGLTGTTYAWIVPFLFFTIGETVSTTSMLLFNHLPLTVDALVSDTLLDPFRYLYLLLAGLLPSLLCASYRLERIVPQKAILPEGLEQKAPFPPSTADMVKTKAFTVERYSGITQNADVQDVSDLLSSVVFFMSRNFRSYSSLGFIFDPMRKVFVLNSFQSKSTNILKNVVIPLGSGIVGRIGTEKRTFMTGDLRVYNSDLMYYGATEQINSILAVPIISESNELLGTLVLDSNDKQAFKDLDKDTLKRFSSLAAALITTSRMRAIQERSANMFQTFYQASHQFTTALKTEDVFKVLFDVVPTVLPSTRQIGIVFDEEKRLGTILCIGGTSSDLTPGFTFPINTGIYSFVFQKRKSVIIADFRTIVDRYYRFIPGEPSAADIRSLAIFPIVDDEQRCRGLYSIESNDPDMIIGETEQVLTTLIENASIAFIRAMLYQRMERLATTDGLTGLNNHRNFQEILSKEIERSRRYKRPIALLLMDIDHFKTFNDTYGHPVGDLVLKEISLCINKSIRINDIAARYGGEEFVVIIPETTEHGALITAERIRSTIEAHTVISLDRQLKVTVSIGCSAFPENAPSQQALIDTADKALYSAKHNGRNRVVLYATGMGE